MKVYDESRYVRQLLAAGGLAFSDEPLQLADGTWSNFYINYRIITDPEMLESICGPFAAVLVEEVGADEFDVVFGPSYAAIPLAVATSMVLWRRYGLKKPFNYNYKELKTHGKAGWLVGGPVLGKRIAIVDDLVTSSGTKRNNWEMLRSEGGIPVATLVGVDRTPNPSVLEEYHQLTGGAPFHALTNLQAIARELGFDSWAECEAARGVKVET